ncbi:MAG: SLBB domain-containing protein [Bacteroidota bacterium]
MKTGNSPSPLVAIVCASLVSMIALHASAQVRRATTEGDLFGDKEKSATLPSAIAQPPGPAMESTIIPESYYVGPSDVFAVNVWTSPPIAFQLTVTPEGTLIIPTVGEIRVADITLAEARKKVLDAIVKRYRVGEPTITLVTPRPILVTVRGNILNPGSYVMAAYHRVDKAVEEANKLLTGQGLDQLQAIQETMSRRRIIIQHKDGTQSRADVLKFVATREDRWNPYLREGDDIVVPAYDRHKNVIGVYGQVNVPGRYEYSRGDSVKDALRIAFGFCPAARRDSVEFSRQDMNGGIVERRIVNGEAILNGTEPDIALQPGDRLLVHGTVDLRGDYRVKVAGEVRTPGTYPITRNSTRLTSVIRAAGGFTEFASLASAEVLRQPIAPSEVALEQLESLRGGVPPDDSTYYYLETSLRLRKEAVNADFVKLFRMGDSTQNIILQDEDIINVPSLRRSIYVFGQVVNPGHVAFTPGQDVFYYIQKAGGLTDRARGGDLKVVKAKTRQWLSPSDTEVEEGDYVWVPKEPERPFGYYLGIIAQSASVVSVAVSIVLLVIQVNK